MTEEELKAQEARRAEEERKAEEARNAEEERRSAEEAEAAELEKQKALEREQRAAEQVKNAFTQTMPDLLSPVQSKVFTEDDFDSLVPKIDFTWKKVDGARRYNFVIKNSSGKILVAKNLSTNKFTLSGNELIEVSENGDYTWSVMAIQNINKEEFTTQVAERGFRIQMEDAEDATLNVDNLVF